MKLHIKLSMALLFGLILVVGITQVYQYMRAIDLISKLSENSTNTLKEREEGFAKTIFSSVEHAVAGTLERGEMEKFAQLLEAQKDIEGLIEFSLYDKNGYITHSSDQSYIKRTLPEDVRNNLFTNSEMVFKNSENAIEIYNPQIINYDCVRCHIKWNVGAVGGITSLRFSNKAILKFKENAEETLSRAKRAFLINGMITLGSVIAFFILTMYISVRRFIVQPVNHVMQGLRDISAGEADLTKRLSITSKDELGQLAQLFNTFLAKLQGTVGKVQKSGIQVTSSSTELAATSNELRAIILQQMESTENVIKAVDEISRVASGLGDGVQEVATMSQETAGFANRGQSDLSRMGKAIHQMAQASKSIYSRFEEINKKAENITTVVTTITKVADQTNLLSLNAAIEAEKAGEYGKGFSVVAQEIRRLADQTAVATLDIEEMVKEMETAVSGGVMEMEKFIKEVERSTEDVDKISTQLTLIIERVQTLSPMFEEVNTAMAAQSQDAQKVNNSIISLGEQMHQTTDALGEAFLAIDQLNEAARGLHDEVSRFKVV